MIAERQPQQEAFDGPFLGVTQSANGYIWRDRLKDAEQANLALAISQRFDLPEVLGRVLAARGVGLEDVDIALNPTLKSLMPDPYELRDMEPAAERVADAIASQERIAIFGDYDVDGASSSALLDRLFQAHGLSPIVYIPDRINEGYGPNAVAIEHLLEQGVEVIIAVDCGTNSFDAFAPALDKGKTVIVVDHHQADERLPDVHALVNPNRQDDLSGMGDLAAAGVVFLLLVAVVRCLKERKFYGDQKAPDLLEYLDIVALATVCDVVPLKGLNRAYVTKGLQVMRRRENLGLKTLTDVAGLKTAPTTYHLGYLLGPRINAGGRIGDSGLGAKLLATTDAHEANDIATRLDRLNNERKEMENRILEEALAEAEREIENDPDLPIVIVGSPDWHKGLVGLVSSRLTERYRRPSLVLSWDGAVEATGSARSISGVDLGAAVRSAVQSGHLVKGGGHAMAAGLTVEQGKYEDLQRFLADTLRESVALARQELGLSMDGALTPRSVTSEFMELLEKAGPYGSGNPGPRFVFPAQIIGYAKIVGENHVKCRLTARDGSALDAIAFRAVETPMGDLLLKRSGQPVHVAGRLQVDNWGGRERIQLVIADAADPQSQQPNFNK